MKTIAGLIFLMAMTTLAQEPSRTENSKPDSVVLHYPVAKAIDENALQSLHAQALDLVKSSNFNSRGTRPWTWEFPDLQAQYRRTVAGRYLLISFGEPRKLATVGGEVTVREIVIGLNNRQYASSLFTIDDEGRVVAHAKYSGFLCVKLFEEIKKITGDN